MPLSITEYLSRGPASSKEIQAETGISQATVSRQLTAMGDQIIAIHQGRSVRYALAVNAFESGNRLPILQIDEQGEAQPIASLRPLAHGGYFVDALENCPAMLLGKSANGFYPQFPYFLQDMAPQGFIGRQHSAQISARLPEFPVDPEQWQQQHIGCYLLSNGEWSKGNLRLGQHSLHHPRLQPLSYKREDYPALAEQCSHANLSPLLIDGDQPKFGTFSNERECHVMVKFSPQGDDPVARRWKDILLTEYHANKILNLSRLKAAETELLELDDRLFLEAKRLDRHELFGQKSMLSLTAIDQEFTQLGSHWPQVMEALHKQQLVSMHDVCNSEILWGFGHMINNNHMHLSNLSLALQADQFSLLPVYDMCSAGFAPVNGEPPAYRFIPPSEQRFNFKQNSFILIKKIAWHFWQNLANDPRISDELKTFLDQGNPVDLM